MMSSTVDLIVKPVVMVNLIGCDMGAINANEVQALMDYACPEAGLLLAQAREAGRYIPFVGQDAGIKTLVITNSGLVYSSKFRLSTLAKRIQEATMFDSNTSRE